MTAEKAAAAAAPLLTAGEAMGWEYYEEWRRGMGKGDWEAAVAEKMKGGGGGSHAGLRWGGTAGREDERLTKGE